MASPADHALFCRFDPQFKPFFTGKGDFFKAHKDTPRGQDMFGSLVIVLPTVHEGGQFVLRQARKEWTLDFAPKFATATEPSACFMAFYGDLEHEVLPVTSGYRVTLTYNLSHKPIHPGASLIHMPFYLGLKQALVDLINDPSTLPNGGYLGFGLMHEYVHTRQDLLDPVMAQLRGSDRALAEVCDALGLRYSLRLLYRNIGGTELNFLTTEALDVGDALYYDATVSNYLQQAFEGLTTNEVEGVMLVGERHQPCPLEGEWFVRQFYRTPATEILELTPMMSSVDAKSPFMTFDYEEANMDYFYGTACMVITLEPPASRHLSGL